MNILIPDSWLREYLETDASSKAIQKDLSLCGPSIERLHKINGEFVYDIEVTTNRVDMMSVYGIAREAAAILPRFGHRANLSSDPFTTKLSFKTSPSVEYLKVKVDSGLCPHFAAILIKKVKVGKSPDWLVKRLELSGMRGLNNVVDISNLLMYELGQPIHTFDYDKITDHAIILRESRAGESLTTLDGKHHRLPGGDIVIEDNSHKLIDLCGVMGGLNSAVDEKTKNVLLFVQTYEPLRIRKTSMDLAHRTQAAVLFEKGLPIESVLPTMGKALRLFKQLTSGQPEPIAIDIANRKSQPKTVTASAQFISLRLGIDLKIKEISSILSSLGFNPQVPWWRKNDINIPEDIVEEVARIYGYHNLPSQLMSGNIPSPATDKTFFWEAKIKSALSHWGFTETYTYSLISKTEEVSPTALKLKNPLTLDWEYLRTSLVPSHLKIISENQGRETELNLFEIANVYAAQKANLPKEELHLILSTTSTNQLKLKGIIEALLSEMGIKNVYPEIHRFEDPGALAVEINLSEILPQASLLKTFTPTSKFSPVIEDVNISLFGNETYSTLVERIKKTSPLIQKVDLVDLYQDKMTLRLTYHSDSHQLTKEEIEPIRQKLSQL